MEEVALVSLEWISCGSVLPQNILAADTMCARFLIEIARALPRARVVRAVFKVPYHHTTWFMACHL